MQAIETVLFDFGGTLDSDGVAWKERFHALYRSEGLDLSADAFAPAFYAADDALVGALAPTTGLEETVGALTTNLEAELARRGGGTGQREIDRARGERVASRFLSEMSFAFARNRPVLEALSERYRLGVVSNFYGNLEASVRELGTGSSVRSHGGQSARRRRKARTGDFSGRAHGAAGQRRRRP